MAVTIKTDRARIAARIKAGTRRMIYEVTEQAKSDCNEYCKYDQGQLRESVETASDFENGILVWDQPYAAYAYYTGEPSHDKTYKMWCEVAHDKHGDHWQEIAQENFDKGMGK